MYENCLQPSSDSDGTAATMWFLSSTILVDLKPWEILGTTTNHSAATWFGLSAKTFTE